MIRSIQDHAAAVLARANACKEHHSGIEMSDVKVVIAAFEGCNCAWNGGEDCGSCCDREGAAVLELNDGRYASVWENEGTTGHG